MFCEKIRQIQHDLNDIELVDLKSLSRSFTDSDFGGMIRVNVSNLLVLYEMCA